jgi:hypothetical protein
VQGAPERNTALIEKKKGASPIYRMTWTVPKGRRTDVVVRIISSETGAMSESREVHGTELPRNIVGQTI